jgi:hypothetical protein
MKDVILLSPKPSLKCLEGGRVDALHLQPALLHGGTESFVELRPFVFHVERRMARWA